MSDIDKTLSNIRPALRHIAPLSFWFSGGFGVFNMLVGIGLFNAQILTAFKVVGIIPLKLWGVIFMMQGLGMIYFLLTNNWKLIRLTNLIGVGVKTMWWFELISSFISGASQFPFLLIIWSLLLFLQAVLYIYFTPRVEYDK